MSYLDFVRKLYKGKNCYSDHMNADEIGLLHIPSGVEDIIKEMLQKGKMVFLTGNPGDGKTFIIKAIADTIDACGAYTQADFNTVRDYADAATEIIECYHSKRAAIIAINEYPFFMLCKKLRELDNEVYEDIRRAEAEAIVYDTSETVGRAVVIDLNERNLLSPDNHRLDKLLDKMVKLLPEEEIHIPVLEYNLQAMEIPQIRRQFISLFELVASECEHFAVRDIIGAFAFALTACTTDENRDECYYSAIFNGSNNLLKAVQRFDPVYLTIPSLDEALWNGTVTDGWYLGAPTKWPNDESLVDDVEQALERFKNIKRRYYFENINGAVLLQKQPDEVKICAEIFTSFDSQRKKIKERIVRSLNKLFLPSSDDKKQLHIWTTHRYDMSREATVAISSKAVDSSDLELKMPRPADWLKGIEYVPSHVILTPAHAKDEAAPVLILDVDFLRTLNAIENGYPAGLLAPQYEQAAATFLQQLDDCGYAEDNDDGEIILASRINSSKETVIIQDGKYDFEEDEH